MRQLVRNISMIIFVLGILSANVSAQTDGITLAWDANDPAEQVTEYRLYYKTGSFGPPYNGTGLNLGKSPIKIRVNALANKNSPEIDISGFNTGVTYRFVLTAYNGKESRYSAEVTYKPQGSADLDFIKINGPLTVPENSTAQFNLKAIFKNGNSNQVNAELWDVDCADASISNKGMLTTESVNTSTQCTVTAEYTFGGFHRSDQFDIEIRDANDTATLDWIAINGPSNVNENSNSTYTCKASFSDGSSRQVAAKSWFVDCPEANISKDGVLTADEVYANSQCSLTAQFSSGGVSKWAQKNVTIKNNATSAVLKRVEIRGSVNVNENSNATFTCRAFYSDGSQKNVKPDWAITTGASFANINSNGVLTTHKVNSNATVGIIASHSDAKSIQSDEIKVTIKNQGTSTQTKQEIIIDNGAAGTWSSGKWEKYTHQWYDGKKQRPYRRNSTYSRKKGSTYTFRTKIDGIYEVALQWIEKYGVASGVPIKIYNGDTLIDTVYVNQKGNWHEWRPLGTYKFDKGFARVVVTSKAPATSIDGIRFLKKNQVAQPKKVIVLDNGDFGTSSSGKWVYYKHTWYNKSKHPPYSQNSIYSRTDWGTYTFTTPIKGKYKVFFRWAEKWGQSNKVPVQIFDGNKLIKTVNVNQKFNSGKWVNLGTFTFRELARVKVTSKKPAASVDGMKFERL